jgi:hypothetical protein
MPVTTSVLQSTAGTSQLNGSAPDPTNVPGLNWYATTNSFARLAGGGITNGNANINTLSYLLPTNLHKTSIVTTSSLNGNQYILLMCNGSANNANNSSGDGYYLFIRGGGIGLATIIRTVAGVGTNVQTVGSVNTNGVIDSAYLDCTVSGTVSSSITFGGNTYTNSYTDVSPLTGSYAGLFFGDVSAGAVTMASLKLESNIATTIYEFASLNRGIGRGIARGIA